ncbi:hypothetical protein J4228_03515 [Candidatus Woesearchaeota archaeon]|nr:hypothetical protein [Candidatus Woesearchaeota archaeon]
MKKENFADEFFKTLTDHLNEIKEVRNKVITLHLYVEFLINNFLEAFFPKPKNIVKFTFWNKIKIIEGIGFNEQLCRNIEKINNFRNQFAHKLDLEGIVFDFGDVFVKEPEKFSQLDDINKIQILAVETLINMNAEFHNFLKWRKEVFQNAT